MNGEKEVHRRRFLGGDLLEERQLNGCSEDDSGGGGKDGEGVGDALASEEVEGDDDDRWMYKRRMRTVASKVSRM